jgi:rRNA maturation RNase YbeY
MEIQITCKHPLKNIDPGKIEMKLTGILKGLEYHDCELSLLFTDDKHIAELNYRFLKREGPTNVLAFPMRGDELSEPETPMLGDIVISLDAAMRDAKRGGESLNNAIDRLLIHGLLHLLGYDHERSEEEARRMEEETERLLAAFNL